jgi:nitroimidazol reductase NimA-like FMN-containing flavoprotein (pyridoxamine 5'-phosphate oxidase superfamily)
MSKPLEMTERTRIRRKANRGTYDRDVVHDILDDAYVCHVGFVANGTPVVIPTAYVRDGDELYLHGSNSNHMLRALADGGDASVAVTLIDGLVLARTAFHHSVNYRSVVMFGRGRRVDALDEKQRVLTLLLERMVVGRSRACRLPNEHELLSTLVIGFPIVEASAKIRSGPPLPEEGDDAQLPYWAGVIPLLTTRGAPVEAS